jgi:hypothetical protein
MRLDCINVRALSAKEGSGTADWPLVGPLACFPKDEDDIAQNSFDMQRIMSYAAVLSAAFERFPLEGWQPSVNRFLARRVIAR